MAEKRIKTTRADGVTTSISEIIPMVRKSKETNGSSELTSGVLRNYSSTGCEIGVEHLPNDWRIGRFDSLFEVQQGKQVSKENRIGENQQPFLRTKNVFWNRLDLTELDKMHFSDSDEKRLALKPNDLLVCEGGDIGRTAIWNGEVARCYYQNHLHRARLREPKTTDALFVLFWLWYAFEYGKIYFGRGNVTTIPNLSQSKLCELPVPIPSFFEQQKIAKILKMVQRAIEQQERLIALTKELKKTLMHKLFTEGTRGEPQKETEIGPVPESWEVVQIGDVIKFSSGKTRPKDTSSSCDEIKSVPVYGGNGILGYSSKPLFDDELLILGRVGEYCGCAHITEKRCWVTDNALYSKEMKRDVNLFYLKNHFEFLHLNQYSNKMGQPLITQGIINDIKFGLPGKEEQIEIAVLFRIVDNKFEIHSEKSKLLTDLFRTLLNQLMTAETRVNDLDFSQMSKRMDQYGGSPRYP